MLRSRILPVVLLSCLAAALAGAFASEEKPGDQGSAVAERRPPAGDLTTQVIDVQYLDTKNAVAASPAITSDHGAQRTRPAPL